LTPARAVCMFGLSFCFALSGRMEGFARWIPFLAGYIFLKWFEYTVEESTREHCRKKWREDGADKMVR
jgi:hypothetical protein